MINQSRIRNYLKNQSLLIIEPGANYRTSLRGFISNLRIEKFQFAQTARDAQIAMLSGKVGLVICEWSLPDLNGIEFCRLMRTKRASSGIPFLLMSAENLSEDVILASEAGISSYLLKPFSFEEFKESLESLLRSHFDPTKLNALIKQAQSHYELQEFDKARILFNQALKINPDSARALAGLGKIARLGGHNKGAMNAFRAALEANPDYLEAISELLYLLVEHAPESDETLELALRAQEMSPHNPRYQLFLSKIYLERANLPEAELCLRNFIFKSSRLSESVRSGELILRGELSSCNQAAIIDNSKTLELGGRDAEIVISNGNSFEKKGFEDNAILCFQAASLINPGNKSYIKKLAELYKKVGEEDKYTETLDRLDEPDELVDWAR